MSTRKDCLLPFFPCSSNSHDQNDYRGNGHQEDGHLESHIQRIVLDSRSLEQKIESCGYGDGNQTSPVAQYDVVVTEARNGDGQIPACSSPIVQCIDILSKAAPSNEVINMKEHDFQRNGIRYDLDMTGDNRMVQLGRLNPERDVPVLSDRYLQSIIKKSDVTRIQKHSEQQQRDKQLFHRYLSAHYITAYVLRKLPSRKGGPDLLRGAYYRTVKALFRLSGTSGSETLVSLLAMFRRIGYAISPGGRQQVYLGHLARIFPDKSESERKKILQSFWKVHQRAMLGLFNCEKYSRPDPLAHPQASGELLERVEWRNRDCLDRALSRGKGVVLLAPHFGDERTLHILLAMAGYPVHVISTDYGGAPDVVRRARLEASSRLHHVALPGDNPRWIFDALGKGEIVQISPTAYGGPKGNWVSTFGVPVLVSSTPLRLMRATGCSLVIGVNHALEGLRYRLDFSDFLPGADASAAPQALFDRIVNLGLTIPLQYNWMNLTIRHRESNTIARIGMIPAEEKELERIAIPEDSSPTRIHSIEEIRAALSSLPDNLSQNQ